MSLRRGSQPIGGDRKKRRLCGTALRYVSAQIKNIFSPIRSSGRDGLDNEFYVNVLVSFSRVFGPTLAIPTVAMSLKWLVTGSEKPAQSSLSQYWTRCSLLRPFRHPSGGLDHRGQTQREDVSLSTFVLCFGSVPRR